MLINHFGNIHNVYNSIKSRSLFSMPPPPFSLLEKKESKPFCPFQLKCNQHINLQTWGRMNIYRSHYYSHQKHYKPEDASSVCLTRSTTVLWNYSHPHQVTENMRHSGKFSSMSALQTESAGMFSRPECPKSTQ